jgi:PAS domain S-box-containing protein
MADSTAQIDRFLEALGADPPVLSPEIVAELRSFLADARESLRHSHASDLEMRRVLDTAAAGITRFDRDFRFITANAAYARVVDVPLDRIIGRTLEEVIGQENFATIRQHVDRVLSGERMEYEARLLLKTGGERVLQVVNTPDCDADGNVIGWVGSVTDVTDRVRAEEALKAANNAKDQFLAVLSHELRTPLTPVLATAELMATDKSLTPEHHDMVAMIRRNVELEARLIDDMLDLTRIARSKLELHLADVDVHEKLGHVISICAAESAAKHLAVRTEFAAEVDHIRADPARFQQILWNLLKNAIKFTPASGTITIATHNMPDGRITITVSDTGVGIEPRALARIFDAFEQGSRNITRQFGGLGLGLAISKALVEMQQGTITATSAGKNQGATFSVSFPAFRESVRDGAASSAAAGNLACSILLVEDHADTRRIMTRLLTSLGCKVESAATVADALQLAVRQRFDLLVSDLGLPDATGFDLMREVKAKYNLRGIALSGYGMDEDIARSREAGFEAHLTKPVNLAALEHVLQRLTT